MGKLLKNRVLIIGADHHNTLAVIRCLGRKNCDLTILIHGKFKCVDDVKVSHSKYAKKKVSVVEEKMESVVSWLVKNKTEEKQIIFPCSDFAQYTIDYNFDILESGYIMPGFCQNPGKCVYLMDKWNQYEFAQQYNIPMAKTWCLKKNIDGTFSSPDDVVFPCIVKPEVSAFGKKTDISICFTMHELKESLAVFSSGNYESLILQKFIEKDFEVCAYGALVSAFESSVGGIIKKEREYPPKGGGSLTFARFIDDEKIIALRDKILTILHNLGYRGQYDIEFFVCGEECYLNEMNFRHSGNGYALVKNGVLAPFVWCLDSVNISIPRKLIKQVRIGKTHMDEIPDLVHRKENNISLFKWAKDFLFTSARSKFDIRDISGTCVYYLPIIKKGFAKLFCRKKNSNV